MRPLFYMMQINQHLSWVKQIRRLWRGIAEGDAFHFVGWLRCNSHNQVHMYVSKYFCFHLCSFTFWPASFTLELPGFNSVNNEDIEAG